MSPCCTTPNTVTGLPRYFPNLWFHSGYSSWGFSKTLFISWLAGSMAAVQPVPWFLLITWQRIKAPSGDAFAYLNRKNFHSVNVQLICDAKCVLLNVVARWPGGTHDAFILRNSAGWMRLEDGAVRDGWLIGKNIACPYHTTADRLK